MEIKGCKDTDRGVKSLGDMRNRSNINSNVTASSNTRRESTTYNQKHAGCDLHRLRRANICISFQLPIQWCDFDSLMSSRVEIFTLRKLVNTMYCFFSPFWGVYQDSTASTPSEFPLHSFFAALTIMDFYVDSITSSDAKNMEFSLLKPQFLSVSGTHFPSEGRD